MAEGNRTLQGEGRETLSPCDLPPEATILACQRRGPMTAAVTANAGIHGGATPSRVEVVAMPEPSEAIIRLIATKLREIWIREFLRRAREEGVVAIDVRVNPH